MIWKLFLFGLFAVLTACSDESPFEAMEEDLQEAEDMAYAASHSSSSMSIYNQCLYGYYTASYCCSNYGYQCSYASSSSSYWNSSSSMSEATKCALGISTYSNSYCCTYYGKRCSYVSSSSFYLSSSSSSATVENQNAHLTAAKTMVFTLTYYKQVTAEWDLGGTSDGDPSISFTIYFIATGGQTTSTGTGSLLSLQNQGTWSGTAKTTISVPVSTKDIKVCPSVVDKDLLSNDIMSSGYCYTITNVGYLSNYEAVEQSDSKATKYSLEWEWYLY